MLVRQPYLLRCRFCMLASLSDRVEIGLSFEVLVPCCKINEIGAQWNIFGSSKIIGDQKLISFVGFQGHAYGPSSIVVRPEPLTHIILRKICLAQFPEVDTRIMAVQWL